MLTDTWYSVLAAAGCIFAAVLFAAALKRRHLRPLFALPFMAVSLLMALIMGKAFYLVFNSEPLSSDGWLAGIIRLQPSEFSFTGFLAGASLGVALAALLWRTPVLKTLDCFAIPCCILAAFIRFAEVFSGDLGLAEMATFGLEEISETSSLAFFPLAVRDQWDQWLLALSTLEALCAILTAVLVLFLGSGSRRRKNAQCDGILFETALFTLCTCGFFFETAKISGGVFYYVHVEQLFSALVMLFLIIRLCMRLSRMQKRLPWLPLGLFFFFVAVNGFSQYFLDKAWRFSDLFPETVFEWLSDHLGQVCYAVMLMTAVCVFFLYLFSCRRTAVRSSVRRSPDNSSES